MPLCLMVCSCVLWQAAMATIKAHNARWVLTHAFLAHIKRSRRGPVEEEEDGTTTCVDGKVRPKSNLHWLAFVGSKTAKTRGRMERDLLKHAHRAGKRANCGVVGKDRDVTDEQCARMEPSARESAGANPRWQFSQGRKGHFSLRVPTEPACLFGVHAPVAAGESVPRSELKRHVRRRAGRSAAQRHNARRRLLWRRRPKASLAASVAPEKGKAGRCVSWASVLAEEAAGGALPRLKPRVSGAVAQQKEAVPARSQAVFEAWKAGPCSAASMNVFVVYVSGGGSSTVTIEAMTVDTNVEKLHAAVATKTSLPMSTFYLVRCGRKLPSHGATLGACGVLDSGANEFCSVELKTRGCGGMDTSEGFISQRLTRKRSTGEASSSTISVADEDALEDSSGDDYVDPGCLRTPRGSGKRRAPLCGDRSARTSDGMGRRTGTKLALGVRDESETQAVTVMVERQNSLMSKALCRPTHKIVAEMPVGAVDVATMPRRSSYPVGDEGCAQYAEAYRKWHRDKHSTSVVQQRWASAKEFRAGAINDWLVTNDHEPFGEWTQDDAGNWKLNLIIVGGAPRVPSAEAICEWAYCYSIGVAKKGGRREYRAMPH